jgi:hypothetical protein
MPSPARHIVNTVGRKDVGGNHPTAGKNVDSRRLCQGPGYSPRIGGRVAHSGHEHPGGCRPRPQRTVSGLYLSTQSLSS